MSRWHQFDFPDLPQGAFRKRLGHKSLLPATLEGGKGSSAPPPDPALIAAHIKSMGIQDLAIQELMALQEAMQPMQEEQMRFSIDSAKTAFDQSQDDRDWMLDRRRELSGMQDKLISDAESFNTEDRQDQLAGQATADVRQAFSQQRGMNARQMARSGVNPSDGKWMAIQNQTGISEALGQAQAGSAAREAGRKEGYALTDRASNALAGYPAMGMQATGAGAQFGGMGLNAANAGVQGMSMGLGQAGQMAGQMGSNATNMWGAQASYKNSQDQIAASSDPFSTMLGAAAGIGTAYALKGIKLP